MPLDPYMPKTRYGISVNKYGFVKSVMVSVEVNPPPLPKKMEALLFLFQEGIAQFTGVEMENMAAADVYRSRIYKVCILFFFYFCNHFTHPCQPLEQC